MTNNTVKKYRLRFLRESRAVVLAGLAVIVPIMRYVRGKKLSMFLSQSPPTQPPAFCK